MKLEQDISASRSPPHAARHARGAARGRAERSSRWLVVHVEDTGYGTTAETGRRALEPFFTTREPGKGTGLGLAVSYTIVQKHGGSVDFKSTVGKGTIFTVQIPILDKAPAETRNGPNNRTAGGR